MATCVVSGTILDISGSAIAGACVLFNTQQPTISSEPVQANTTSSGSGTWSVTLTQGISGIFTISTSPSSTAKTVPYLFSAKIPTASTASFSSIVGGF